ncbi:M23 family metallopeptidase [Agathobaculum sp. NTUH-O15-33]|uniref:M23 family metallopeptidase n=1 Tax=Agathobaculum sp. NTUH-O15-33 TaxID=3079302 RepID=UPI0029587C06|nr:M23 family metallopeptidase [Agathobaculum sp. NTUH-O15-33]WNX84196.1 M23 family metallopeptidase [Agathobaculum sp. NTUH-O15-33]
MKNYQSKHVSTLSTRGFYTILTICALIIAVSVYVLTSTASRGQEEGPATISTPIIAPTEAIPDLSGDEPVSADEPEPAEPASATAETKEKEQAPAVVETVHAPVYVRPTSGAIITPFSGDELLYQPTLGDWRTHTGTDIGAEPGEPVLALTDGTVISVYDDALYGTSVTVSHDAELTTTYSGLDAVRVSAGQAVEAGETLGTCAETIDAEADLGTHIHVVAQRAGTNIDVLELLGEAETE